MEETEVDLKVPHDPISQLEAIEHYRKTGKREKQTVNTRNILFIMSGAFGGLEDIVKKRLNREGIGFGAEIRSKDERAEYLKQVKAEDLIVYGFESEFIGRLPVSTVFEKLEVDDLYAILKNPNNPIVLGKKKDFKSYGIDIQFEDQALLDLAVKAYEEKTGARGLVSAVEKVLLKFEKRLPSTEIRKFLVTQEVVKNPEQELKRLLEDPSNPDMLEAFEQLLQRDIKGVEDSIRNRRGELERRYELSLWEARIRLIAHRVVEKGYDVNTVFEEVTDVKRQIEEMEREFDRKHHILLTFDEEAIDQMTVVAFEEDEKGVSVCARLSKDLEHGLKLIRDKTGKTEFIISKEAIKDPGGFLNVLIRDVYSKKSDPSTEGSL